MVLILTSLSYVNNCHYFDAVSYFHEQVVLTDTPVHFLSHFVNKKSFPSPIFNRVGISDKRSFKYYYTTKSTISQQSISVVLVNYMYMYHYRIPFNKAKLNYN